MALTLYYHPFSSYCQKALIALYETGASFEPRVVNLGSAEERAELARLWPLARFPVLRDEKRGVTVPESSAIIAYLDHHYPGAERLIPEDFDEALRVDLFDRLIDTCLMVPVAKVVVDRYRAEGRHDEDGVEQAKGLIGTVYGMLENELGEDGWVANQSFTLADCAAAPALFYANTFMPLAGYPKLAAYYGRLLARPSFARVVDEARPFRDIFPLPWPAGYD